MSSVAPVPPELSAYLARLQSNAANLASSRVSAALAGPSNSITAQLQAALQTVCGHALDHRVLELVEGLIFTLNAEATVPAERKIMNSLVDRLTAGEGLTA